MKKYFKDDRGEYPAVTLKFSASVITKVQNGTITEIFVKKNDENKGLFQQIRLLDEGGSTLNNKRFVVFSAWEDPSFTVEKRVRICIKPGRADAGVDPEKLYYSLKVIENG